MSGDRVTCGPRWAKNQRNHDRNPRALGTNPRALGTNPNPAKAESHARRQERLSGTQVDRYAGPEVVFSSWCPACDDTGWEEAPGRTVRRCSQCRPATLDPAPARSVAATVRYLDVEGGVVTMRRR